MENPPGKFFRLAPGREVRLRYAYLVTCTDVIHDDSGNVVEVHCTYDPETRGGNAPDGRKVKGTIHWVSARHASDPAHTVRCRRQHGEPEPAVREESLVRQTGTRGREPCRTQDAATQEKEPTDRTTAHHSEEQARQERRRSGLRRRLSGKLEEGAVLDTGRADRLTRATTETAVDVGLEGVRPRVEPTLDDGLHEMQPTSW